MDQNNWLTIHELFEFLKIGRSKIYLKAQDCEIPASMVGIQRCLNRDEIDEWMKNQRPTALTRIINMCGLPC